MDIDEKNCFVCKTYLGPFRNSLTSKMEASEKSVYKLLESLLDIRIKRSIRKTHSVCQDCFIQLERYEDLQKEAESIQGNLHTLHHSLKTEDFEAVHIKVEPLDDAREMNIRCTKCGEMFSNLHELKGHKKCDENFEESLDDSDEEYLPKKRRKYQTKNLLAPISKNFKELAKNSGVDYNLDSFHRAFGAPIEKSSNDCSQKKINFKNEHRRNWISPQFAKTLRQHGINYSLQTFHRVFGFSDSLDLQKKPKADCFKCSQCGMEYEKLQHYKAHAKTHEVSEFSCSECTINFQSKLSLDLHLSSNHGRQKEGPFVCPVCLKAFTKKELLRSHLIIHNEERKYLCTQCGATFIHRRSFEMHLMVHDDIRPFECNICSKKFRSKTKLAVHMRIHTGERNYECPHCPPGKTFRQKWGMDLHIKKIHSNEPSGGETCQICGMNFQHKSKLRQHLANTHQVANAENYGDYDQ